jgi:hypothetical protein
MITLTDQHVLTAVSAEPSTETAMCGIASAPAGLNATFVFPTVKPYRAD